MSVEQLHRFMVEHQGEEHHTLSDSEKVFERVLQERKTCQETVKIDHSTGHEITLDELFRLLLHNDFNGPLKTQVHHDMGAPLSHYFIYTGHNSYLKGNQLSSDYSEEPIIEALKRGDFYQPCLSGEMSRVHKGICFCCISVPCDHNHRRPSHNRSLSYICRNGNLNIWGSALLPWGRVLLNRVPFTRITKKIELSYPPNPQENVQGQWQLFYAERK